MTFLGLSTSGNESSGPETILPFIYMMPPEPKTELCKSAQIYAQAINLFLNRYLKVDITLAALVRIFGHIILNRIIFGCKLQMNHNQDQFISNQFQLPPGSAASPAPNRVHLAALRCVDVAAACPRWWSPAQGRAVRPPHSSCWHWAEKFPHPDAQRRPGRGHSKHHRRSSRCQSCSPGICCCVFCFDDAADGAGIYPYHDPATHATFAARLACNACRRQWPISYWHKSTSPCVTFLVPPVARSCVFAAGLWLSLGLGLLLWLWLVNRVVRCANLMHKHAQYTCEAVAASIRNSGNSIVRT